MSISLTPQPTTAQDTEKLNQFCVVNRYKFLNGHGTMTSVFIHTDKVKQTNVLFI